MKRLPILKTLTDILFVLSVIIMFFTIPFAFILAVMPQMIPFELFDVAPTDIPTGEVIALFVAIPGLVLYIYALYLFRNTLTLFKKNKFFDNQVIINFDRIGKAIIAGFFITTMPLYLYTMFAKTVFLLKNDESWFTGDTLFTLVLGLFFIVLSEVFRTAKAMQEENDLTV